MPETILPPYYERRARIEAEITSETEKKEGLPTFLIKKYFGWALVFCFVLFFLAFVLKDERGQAILPQNYFIAGIILVILIFVLPSILSLVTKKPTEKYIPFNSKKELAELEENLSQIYGGSHRIIRHAGDEKYTSKANEPNVMHFRFLRYFRGKTREGHVKIGLIGRPILDYEPEHTHIENLVYDWTGAPKYPSRFTPVQPRYIYRFKPISVEPTSRVIGEKEESKEDEDEESE